MIWTGLYCLVKLAWPPDRPFKRKILKELKTEKALIKYLPHCEYLEKKGVISSEESCFLLEIGGQWPSAVSGKICYRNLVLFFSSRTVT